MNLRQVFAQTSDATLKGRALSALAAGVKGAHQTAVLTLTGGNLADQDDFKVGVQAYEIHLINGAEAATLTVATDDGETVAFSASPTPALVKDEVFLAGTEFMKVTRVVSSTSYEVERGFAGSTAAVHAAATVKRRAQAPSLGREVPVTTVTSSTADAEVAKALNYWFDLDGSPVEAVVGTTLVTLDRPYSEADPTNDDSGLSNGNTLSDFAGGADDGGFNKAEVKYTAVAADVTRGSIPFTVGFTPAGVEVKVFSAAGAAKAWDGTFSISGRVVTVNNGGTTDWAATDVLFVTIYG